MNLDDKVHPSKRAQIAHRKANKVPTKVPNKFADFADVFLPKLVIELPKYTGINNYGIKLVDD